MNRIERQHWARHMAELNIYVRDLENAGISGIEVEQARAEVKRIQVEVFKREPVCGVQESIAANQRFYEEKVAAYWEREEEKLLGERILIWGSVAIAAEILAALSGYSVGGYGFAATALVLLLGGVLANLPQPFGIIQIEHWYGPKPPEPDPLASVKGQQVFGDAFFAAAGEARSALGARAAAGASSMKFKD